MADLFLLPRVQMCRIERYFPLSHGIARVDDWRIVSAIVFVIKNGLRWREAHLQSVCSLEPPGRVQQDFRRTGGQRRQTGADHDRRKPFKKGPVPDVSGTRCETRF
jgi:hypothetical protein